MTPTFKWFNVPYAFVMPTVGGDCERVSKPSSDCYILYELWINIRLRAKLVDIAMPHETRNGVGYRNR